MQKAVPSPAPPVVWVPPPPVLPTPAPPELLPPEWDPLAADPVPPLPPLEFPLLPEFPVLPVLPVLPDDPLPVDELVLDPEEDVELLAGSVELDDVDVDVDEVERETVAAAFP